MKLATATAIVSLIAAAEAGKIRSDSKAGQKLMKHARALNQNWQDVEPTWVANMDIKFESCHEQLGIAGEGQEAAEGNPLIVSRLAQFSLCPTSGSGKCGQYVIDLQRFTEAWTEMKQELAEQKCEYAQQICENNGGNYYDCLEEQGVSSMECGDNGNDQNGFEFEVQEYLECQEMPNYEGGEYNPLFVGPYCSGGDKILFGVFTDEACVQKGSKSEFATYNYGNELPYSSTSIVEKESISCKQVDNDNQNNNNNNQNNQNGDNYWYEDLEVNQLCEAVYEESAKCESGMSDPYYPQTAACDYIKNVLPQVDAMSSSSKSGNAAKAWAWVFGISTVALAGATYYFWDKSKRSTVDLSSQEEGAMA